MHTIKPETPLTMEDILLQWNYVITFKDKDVCVLENPKDRKSRPICIPQQVGIGGLSLEIMHQILFDAKLDPFIISSLEQAFLAKIRPNKIKTAHYLNSG